MLTSTESAERSGADLGARLTERTAAFLGFSVYKTSENEHINNKRKIRKLGGWEGKPENKRAYMQTEF
jgi:hypothetical protein